MSAECHSFSFLKNFTTPTVGPATPICFISELLASLIILFLFLCAVPATEIARDVCFGSKDNPSGSFKIKQAGGLVTLRVDYEPSLPVGETKDLKLDDEKGPVTPEYTTSDNIHFDFRFDYDPLEVTVDQEFLLFEDSGSGEEICVSVWGYYSDTP